MKSESASFCSVPAPSTAPASSKSSMKNKAEGALEEMKTLRSVPGSLIKTSATQGLLTAWDLFSALPEHGGEVLFSGWAAGKLWVGGGRYCGRCAVDHGEGRD